ncbi:hypothetical protein KKE19_00900 [Patescibacteria group bacterium]|nr:hypothetical protein [Patescibacteria group bacterium]MBU4274352.1 hypothetical protein [Patescibacteria group bacterium]MBU4367540.1 hypothetical protein [Patescibacteria group bacterium]MBU4461581.1 hypothetical protein [Patescibacteria group bacterium]MCG2699478.1 hypothetical protein [Candidatus Parcubacteria bacterium]
MPDASTQDFLEVQDIREGILILKNQGLRGVLMVSSLNFALKSDDEQTAIIYAFQNFLNSLDFSCQIIIQSRNINITPYLDELKDLEERQTSELLKEQTASYREFIKQLVQGDTIMTKNFYTVVPYTLMEALGVRGMTKKFGLSKLFGKKDKQPANTMTDADFQRCKTQLWQRMEFLAMGLRRCGLEAIPLTTAELIELFWAIHHPEQAEIGYYPEILPELIK